MKILFVIRSLENGGAERQLSVLANELGRRGHEVALAVFHRGGVHEATIDPKLVRLIDLDKRSGNLGFLRRLFEAAKSMQPDVIHGYLSAGNIAATAARRASPGSRLVWGIRDSVMEYNDYPRKTQFVYSLACNMSRFSDILIFNSTAGQGFWKSQGWIHCENHVIPNGIDAATFAPDRAAGQRMREEWGIPKDAVLIGAAGRLDLKKDHDTLLRAAQIVCQRVGNARFVIAGGGASDFLTRLQELSVSLGIADRVVWTGPIRAMRSFYNALDVFCLSSRHGEGFPNVLGEAMACGCQCVTTDVGDSAWIAADAARVVPASNPQVLADALCQTLDKPLRTPEQVRARIVNNFTVTALADRSEEVFGFRAIPNGFLPQNQAVTS